MDECLFELTDVWVHKSLHDGNLSRESGCFADFLRLFFRTGLNLGGLDDLYSIPLPGLSMHGFVNTCKATYAKLCTDIIVSMDPLGLHACSDQPEHEACG